MVKKIHTNSQVETLSARIEELDTNYKRVLADYQNQERRFKETQNQFVKYANAILLDKLLPNIDSLEMASTHLKDSGLKIAINELKNTLGTEGLKEIISDNKPFDPIIMDCIEVTPGKKDQVTETITKGYFLFDKVLRPAKVKVGSGANLHPHENEDLSNNSGSPSSLREGTPTKQSI